MKGKRCWFIIAVLAQLVLLVLMVIPRLTLLAGGQRILLDTIPDRGGVIRGHYVALHYEISYVQRFNSGIPLIPRRHYYVIIQRGKEGIWRPRAVTRNRPRLLAADQAVIRGKAASSDWLEYGSEEYYLSQDQLQEMGRLLDRYSNKLRVEVKVNRAGEATVVRLRVGNRWFEY